MMDFESESDLKQSSYGYGGKFVMRKLIVPILFVLAICVVQCGADADVRYGTYVNEKFGYEVEYPEKVLIPQGESANGYGQVFQSKDEKAVLRVYASFNVADDTLEESYEKSQSGEVREKEIDEKAAWFSVSGVKNGSVYYVEKYLIDDVFFIYEFEYPEGKKDYYVPIDKVMSKSFKVY